MKGLTLVVAYLTSAACLSTQVFLRGPDSKTRIVEVELSDSVYSLKSHLAQRLGVAHDCLRLVYAGRNLADDNALFEQNIEAGSTVQVHWRFYSCGGSKSNENVGKP